jgi:hypothetical protein
VSTLAVGVRPPTSTDRAQSSESRAMGEQLGQVAAQAAGTIPFGPHVQAMMALFEACADATAPGWNGPGTAPVPLAAYLNAERFVQALPTWAPVPEIAVYPDGEIEFEWYAGPRRVFAVSVGSTELLNYAGIFGINTAHGTQLFVDEFPTEFSGRLADLGFGHL